MSSSQPFQASSPMSAGGSHLRRKSRFTYKQLAALSVSSTSCPLRVIAHVDLDAFYAQCEMVRLGVPEDQPLAVQQWQGLIAINYPSRKFGLSRHVDITEAKKLCPNLIMQHVATWKEGEEKWAYHEDAAKNIATHKVSLDPYRLESRRILSCIKETLPANTQKVEKASIDEVFMDLSAQVHSILLERYPELKGPAPYDDPTEQLPLPPTTVLDWQADALVDLDVDETEDDDPDWDDVAILIGSEIVRDARAAVREKLKYTCSGGIAQNKMLAKLGSAHKKPNQQSVIRNRAVQMFLSDFKFTKIRGLGGKLGDQITSAFNTDTVKDLLAVPVEQLKQKLGDDTGTWVFQIIRGVDSSEVNSRTQIKSMLSAKSFRPSINTPEQAHRWLRIFAADIYSRLVEEGVLENKRRPKTLTIHFRHGGQTKSRQAPISLGKKIDETALFELAKNLLGQIILEGRVWPCSNISLSVGGFEDGIQGNLGIGAFLVKGDEAKAMISSTRGSSSTGQERPEKRRRLEGTSGIQKFFGKSDGIGEHDDEFGAHDSTGNAEKNEFEKAASPYDNEVTKIQQESMLSTDASALHQQQITDYICSRCNQAMAFADVDSHRDWHFAKDLQDEEKGQLSHRPQATTTAKTNKKAGTNASKKKPAKDKPEKGQSKLAFG
ncbi:DNA/RNA polymerase [Hyaloscypha variabilis F]|uniref:DNA polymerase eta n=1 Tax=Hyaloscypha variabilis (strain UAMH 11265 / GT02V1 / F) TaxID=1149755 RepID=A0A2J6QWZ9_HYAVF|nr:DNA/RNA polymerase [Hyaloscypha variabilis F]